MSNADILMILVSILSYCLAILIVIFIHELGHYSVARIFNVQVDVFKIGFGRTFFKKKMKSNTIFEFGFLPLGGYIKMASRDNVKNQNECINDKTYFQKVLIYFFGPFANILLALFLFFAIDFFYGIQHISAVIDTVKSQSLVSNAGVVSMNRITQINNQAVNSWDDIKKMLNKSTSGNIEVTFENNHQHEKKISFQKRVEDETALLFLDRIGVVPIEVNSKKVGIVNENSPAKIAGLERGDVFISINGKKVYSWRDVSSFIKQNPQKTLNIKVYRNKKYYDLILKPHVVIKANGKKEGFAGFSFDIRKLPEKFINYERFNLLESLKKSINTTYLLSNTLFSNIINLISGKISINNLSGPIATAKVAGETFYDGFVSYVFFVAFISLNLAIINLLPIPVLDGGQIINISIEKFIKPNLREMFQVVWNMTGLMIILVLLVIVFFNDVARI